ncbi:MAG: hypothetical protein WC683_02735 [bacterium]
MIEPFTKHVLVGTGDCGKVFVTIKWDGKRLSLTGVEGPLSNGDAKGGCGQIDLVNVTQPFPGIDVAKLAEVWNRWHLNDMRAGCEHQRKDWDVTEKVEVIEYMLKTEHYTARNNLVESGVAELVKNGSTAVTERQRFLLSLPLSTLHPLDVSFYRVHKRETKATGWVRPEEHPKGLLNKPCPECGYKYGSQWLYEEVPEDVIAFLKSLPETVTLPGCWARD